MGSSYYTVLVASQRFHGKAGLTYNYQGSLSQGQLVAVPLQNKKVLGIIESKVPKPAFSSKEITDVWSVFIPATSLHLLEWLKSYYPAPLGLLTELFTPTSLPKNLNDTPESISVTTKASLPPLTPEQKGALKIINSAGHKSILLHGDTGTGKTRIYLELAKQALELGKSVLILTPEIGLTEPMLVTFRETFGKKVIVTHSEMTGAKRRSVWLAASRSDEGMIIIGPRSALFAPLKQIGLIVMDEAHDSAYKQEQAPYYQTSRVAAKLASLHGARFVMGTATPAISDHFTFDQKNLPIVRLIESAIEVTQNTAISVIDQRAKENFSKSRWLASSLLGAIESAIKNGEQTLLFLNRRGSARLVFCDNCGWQAMCPHCDVALTYHQDKHSMICHSCDFSASVPTSCPSCGKSELIFKSIGTKALESEIVRLFPGARVSRFDSDTHKSLRLSQQFQALHDGEVDIIIGTQTVAKGFDLPKLSVVGIVQADSGLQLPDFTAAERTFQLISQVSGRIGRGHRGGKLFVQTYEPDSQLIKQALQKDYNDFYNHELGQRKIYRFPPYSFLLKVSCARATSNSAFAACQKIKDSLSSRENAVSIDGPSPRFIEKIAGRFAWHLVIRSKDRKLLTDIVSTLPANCTYDLDPSDLL